jgi:hypothetical protein
MILKFQVTAFYSCGPPDINSSKLLLFALKVTNFFFSKITEFDFVHKIVIPRPMSQVTNSNHSETSASTFRFPEACGGEAWDVSNKIMLFSLPPTVKCQILIPWIFLSTTFLLFFVYLSHSGETPKLNSVASVRKRAILTKRPPLVGEVSANFCG